MTPKNYISIALLSFTSLLIFIFYYLNQPSLDYNQCLKCDGNSYLSIYDFFNEQQSEYAIKFPFNGRLFVPFLASILPFSSKLLNFHLLNVFFIIISITAIYILWSDLKIGRTLKFIGLFWLIFHWIGIIRHQIFDVANVDTPLYFFHTLLLLIVYRKKYNWLPILAIIATSQKESFPVYLIVLLLFTYAYNRFYEQYFHLKPIVISLILAFATKIIINFYFPPIEQGINSFIAVLFYIKQIFINPESLVVWVVAVFTSYGAFLLLAFIIKSEEKIKPEHQLLFLFAMLSIVLSIIAGGDFTRISFLGFPFVMTWILIRIKTTSVFNILIAFTISVPLLRILSPIPEPDYINNFHPWFIEFSSNETVLFWSIYMIISYLLLHRIIKYTR